MDVGTNRCSGFDFSLDLWQVETRHLFYGRSHIFKIISICDSVNGAFEIYRAVSVKSNAHVTRGLKPTFKRCSPTGKWTGGPWAKCT